MNIKVVKMGLDLNVEDRKIVKDIVTKHQGVVLEDHILINDLSLEIIFKGIQSKIYNVKYEDKKSGKYMLITKKHQEPEDPFVKRSELKRELMALETRLTIAFTNAITKAMEIVAREIRSIREDMNTKTPQWFIDWNKNVFIPTIQRIDDRMDRNNLIP